MNTERRKRQVPNGDNGRRARPRGDEVGKAASEEDVEEFFAILRRMHAVAGYVGDRKGGNGLELTDGGRSWRPAFEWEDFEGGGNGAKSRGEEKGKSVSTAEEGEKKEREDEKRSTREWDLNAEPEPENASMNSS